MKDYKIFCMWCLDPEDLRYYYWLPSDDLHTEEFRLQDFVTIDNCAFAQFSNYVVRGLVGKRFFLPHKPLFLTDQLDSFLTLLIRI